MSLDIDDSTNIVDELKAAGFEAGDVFATTGDHMPCCGMVRLRGEDLEHGVGLDYCIHCRSAFLVIEYSESVSYALFDDGGRTEERMFISASVVFLKEIDEED
jgi:hypothetical protein